VVAIVDLAGRFWSVVRKVEELVELQTKTRIALEKIDSRLRLIEDRMLRLEEQQGQVIVEAKAAAGFAATGLAGSVISDVVTRVTRIEIQQQQIQLRLPQDRDRPATYSD
jgi:hypothetical protein